MIILGMQEAHDASCCIMKDGKVIAAAQEERFSGRKGDYGLPIKVINACMNEVGLTRKDIDLVALASKNWNPVLTKIKRNANFSVQDWVDEQNYYWLPKIYKGKNPDYYKLYKDKPDFVYDTIYDMNHLLTGYMDKNEMEQMQEVRTVAVEKWLGIDRSKVVFVTHEDCHKYYAWLGSDLQYKNCTVITSEGVGDYSNGTVSPVCMDLRNSFKGYKQMCLDYETKIMTENHIGHIYQYITLLLGMKPAQHEHKVMGLAPYANEKEVEKAYKVFKDVMKVEDGRIIFNKRPPDLYKFFREALEGCRFDGIAGAVQKMTEELLTELVKQIGAEKVCFAGGVAQNIKACKKMSEVDCVKDFSVMPAAGDTSISIGACYYENHFRGNKSYPLDNIYLGPSFSNEECLEEINIVRNSQVRSGMKLKYSIISKDTDYFFQYIASLLKEGNVIARCAGRMEFGLRALGNRSILADPRDVSIIKKINDKIKFRDFWMPFTPTILAERADDYIVNPKGLRSPYMTMAFDSTELARKEIPAALHPADYTVRPQILSREMNPDYYDIIKEFERLTGVGAILNTSFNLHGEPIVLGPKEAIRTFLKSELDYLLLNNILVWR